MSIAEEVFEGIGFFVTAASDPTADHTHPVVFRRLAEGASGWLMQLNFTDGFASRAEEAIDLTELLEKLGGHSSKLILQFLKACYASRDLNPLLIIHKIFLGVGPETAVIDEIEAFFVVLIGRLAGHKDGLLDVER